MTPSPKTKSEFEAAAEQMLAKLNRSGAMDRLRKVVESRMTGDNRRMDNLNADIAAFLKDQPPKPSDKPDPKALVTLAKKQVLTPALDQDIRDDIETAIGQLQMKTLFNAEMDKLSQAEAPEKKQVDLDQVRNRERKAFLATIIKPINASKQHRPPERNAARNPTSTAQSRGAPSRKGSNAGAANAHPVTNTRRGGEDVARRSASLQNGKRPRAPAKRPNHGGRIPPSAAKPPAGPHKAEVRRGAETAAGIEKGLVGQDEEHLTMSARHPLESQRGSESGGDVERPPGAESADKKPVDESANKTSEPGASGKGERGVGKRDSTKDEGESREKPSSPREQRPRSGNTDPSVAACSTSPDANSREEAGIPSRTPTQAKGTRMPAKPIRSGERSVAGSEAAIDENKVANGERSTAESAPLEKDNADRLKEYTGPAEGDAVELESPLPSWRRLSLKHTCSVSEDGRSWTSDSSSEEPEITLPVEIKKPKVPRGECDTKEVPPPAVSASSYEEEQGLGEVKSDSSEEDNPDPQPPSRKRPDETEEASNCSSGNRGTSNEERRPTRGRGGGTDAGPVQENTKARARKPSSRERSLNAGDEKSRTGRHVRASTRHTSRQKAGNPSKFLSEPLDERVCRDGTVKKETYSGSRAGAKTTAARKERKRARGKGLRPIPGQFEKSKGDEAHPTRKRRRVPSIDAEVEPSYDFAEQQKVLRALRKLAKEAHAYPFLQPVDPKDEGCEDYYNEIACPMSISTITERLESSTPKHGHYARVEDVMQDVELIWSNCRDFNGSYDPVVKDADKCVNSLDIFLEKEGLQAGIGGRSKRRRSRGTSLNDCGQEESSSGRDLGEESQMRTSSAKTDVLERQAELARENTENDGHLVDEDVIVFTKDGSKKSWLQLDVFGYNPDSRTYTIRWRRSGKVMEKVRFGPFTPYPIVRIAGKPL